MMEINLGSALENAGTSAQLGQSERVLVHVLLSLRRSAVTLTVRSGFSIKSIKMIEGQLLIYSLDWHFMEALNWI